MARQLTRRGLRPVAVLLFALLLTPLLQACGRDEAQPPEPQTGGIVMTVEPTAAAPVAPLEGTEAAATEAVTEPATEIVAPLATEPAAEAATEGASETGVAATEALTGSAAVDASEAVTDAAAAAAATESAAEAATEAATEAVTEAVTEAAEPVVTLSVGQSFTATLPVRVHALPGEDAPAIALYNQGTAFTVIEPDLERLEYPVLVEGAVWLRVRAEDGLAGWVLAAVTE